MRTRSAPLLLLPGLGFLLLFFVVPSLVMLFAPPGATAAALFPREAAANHGIFYTKAGAARSLAQVYALMAKKIDAPAELPPLGAKPDPETLARLSDGLPPQPLHVAAVLTGLQVRLTRLATWVCNRWS